MLGNAGAQTYKKQAAAIKASIQKNMYDKTLHTFTDGVGIDHSAWHSTAFPAYVLASHLLLGHRMRVLGAALMQKRWRPRAPPRSP